MRVRCVVIVTTLHILLLTSCANDTDKIPQKPVTDDVLFEMKEKQRVFDIPFKVGHGRAIVIINERFAESIVFANDLNPEERYTISLVGDNGTAPGVMFGPKETVEIHSGTIEDEVFFRPNSEGELFVSMRNPIRMFTEAKELAFEITTIDRDVILKTMPFVAGDLNESTTDARRQSGNNDRLPLFKLLDGS